MVTACGASGNGAEGTQQEAPPASSSASSAASGSDAAQAAPKPDFSGVPDVVAQVNGEKVSKAEFTKVYESQFQQLAMQAQMTGQPLDQEQLKKQTAEGLVGTKLLIQDAKAKKIQASKKDVNAAMDKIAKANKLDRKGFLAALQKQGMDEAEVKSQLGTQVRVQELLAQKYGAFTASEKELKAAYKQAREQQAQMPSEAGGAAKLPSYKELKPQLKEQLETRKESEASQKLVAELKKTADVKINL
jgi:peptidyl-prolyl cis-trans isomerase SurA